jgi:hypothetical protein
MVGNKTHEQQLRIFEKQVNTKNGDADFDAEADLKRSKEGNLVQQDESLRGDAVDVTDPDDRNIIRGENQSSRHHKGSAQE